MPDNEDEGTTSEKQEILEMTLLGLSYIESRIYGDSSVSKAIDENYAPEEIVIAVCGLASSFISMSAMNNNMEPTEILANIRRGIITLSKSLEDGEEGLL